MAATFLKFPDRTEFHTSNGRMAALYHPYEIFGNQRPSEINWACVGAVSLDTAEEFAIGILELVRIGRKNESPAHPPYPAAQATGPTDTAAKGG